VLDYKKLLGDKYNESLKPEEILALLNGLNLADLSSGEYVAKGKFDARESEIANLKKAIAEYQEKENANLTDAQKKDLEHQTLIEEKEKLEKQVAEFKFKDELIKNGFSADECAKIVEAQSKGESIVSVYANIMKTRTEEATKSAKAESIKKSTPPAPQGDDLLGGLDEDDEDVAFARDLAQSNQLDGKSIDAIKGAYSSLGKND